MDARRAAVAVLQRVLGEGRSLDRSLAQQFEQVPADQRALTQQLVYGVLRHYSRLDAVAAALLQKPLRARDDDVRFLLLLGLYQCLEMRTPAYAAVSETVSIARKLGKKWAVGLLNATLRRFLRERESLLAGVDRDPAVRYAHPQWMLDYLRASYPEHYEAVLAANNDRAPMTLRVNRLRVSREDYLRRLREAGLVAETHPYAPDALVLEAPVPVERLPGFTDGWVSVQDAAAQLAVGLLDVPPGARVLDACAAPGGKAAHLLERYPDIIELVALDVDAERLARVEENFRRLGLQATLRQADAAEPEQWWDGRPFERILLDAPCSGSGVIRRHPDIKWLRRRNDLPRLAAEQRRLLYALWPLLAPGGKLVFATCSVFPSENQDVVGGFVAESGAEPISIDAPWGLARGVGRQLLPGERGMDGFYYACLGKAKQ